MLPLPEDELEANRNILGGARLLNSPAPVPSSFSPIILNSSTPSPPPLRHKRATRSALSRTFTKRTAPASSTAKDDVSRKMRMVGNVSSWAP